MCSFFLANAGRTPPKAQVSHKHKTAEPMSAPLSKLQRRGRRTLRIALAWAVAGLIASIWKGNTLNAVGILPDRWTLLLEHTLAALLGGLLGGAIYVFILRDRLRKLAFVPAFAIMSLLIAAFVGLELLFHRLPGTDHETVAGIIWAFLGEFLFWDVLMGATMLMVRVNDQFGSGAPGFLLGRYLRPRQELRIFMFLDMRSSTTIAEEIGDTRYFQLLNDVYADITDPVVYSGGDIYQYVGDEISVSWQVHIGAKNQRCLRCFFSIRDKLRQRAEHYRQRYGIVPVFKAGFHCGQVTTGEIGLVKKQTVFSGDVVNTAAHIQAACNQHGVDNLVSKDLLDVLALPPAPWEVRAMGEVPLKGKRRSMALYNVEPKS